MTNYYFSVNLDNVRTLCLAPLSDRQIAASGESVDDASGYFLYEIQGSGEHANVEILAHVASDDAALRLREMFRMS